jgi:hypothetical protein
MEMKVTKEEWNDSDERKPKYLQKNMTQYHLFAHHISHTV